MLANTVGNKPPDEALRVRRKKRAVYDAREDRELIRDRIEMSTTLWLR